MLRKIYLTIAISGMLLASYGQNRSLSVGLKLLNEIDLDGGSFYPGVGGQIVYRMTKHSGLESGLYYSNQTLTFITYYFSANNSGSFVTDISERWLMLPLLYRFDSKAINFTAGPQIDYFLGWKNKNKNPSLLVNNYSRPVARLGVTGGINKSIRLSPKWLLEPEARLIFYPSEEHGTAALNLAVRRKLF